MMLRICITTWLLIWRRALKYCQVLVELRLRMQTMMWCIRVISVNGWNMPIRWSYVWLCVLQLWIRNMPNKWWRKLFRVAWLSPIVIMLTWRPLIIHSVWLHKTGVTWLLMLRFLSIWMVIMILVLVNTWRSLNRIIVEHAWVTTVIILRIITDNRAFMDQAQTIRNRHLKETHRCLYFMPPKLISWKRKLLFKAGLTVERLLPKDITNKVSKLLWNNMEWVLVIICQAQQNRQVLRMP